ncbi:MAG TPA: ATP-dependent DNA helicase RecQ, partial [Phycisphaerae bacterium]|nr:ATP-dependent DNA helicase RecQ [Phycisphaerae bacterium]
VVMPTGGGKSLCYQAPALLADRPTVVVSPLIALMKDQVDNLSARGVPAAFLNSSLTVADRRRVADGMLNGEYKLIFVAPERFASGIFWDLLEAGGVGAFAIDEAHCISHWGHDFRSDYRRLDQLRQRYPDASLHAFTATATPRVREDIAAQLHLREPEILVGDFFRPNLKYAAIERAYGFTDVIRAVKNRSRQAGIVYCIRRADVDELAASLQAAGVNAAGYHAGLSDDARTRVQDAFTAAETDVIVATVAFGMGIDRSDIRFVFHAALPKSIEHYQQETGRAGRDGAPADCTLFHHYEDYVCWQSIIEKEGGSDASGQLGMLREMYAFATSLSCRHRKLVTYFGQEWNRTSCDACDVCCGDVASLPDATVLAQKIMSAVYRTGERYGPAYIGEVLVGDATERVQARGHDQIPTFAAMLDYPIREIRAWIDQLADQGLLRREGEYNILKITPAGWRVLRSETDARLMPVKQPKRARKSRSSRRKTPGDVFAPGFGPASLTSRASGPAAPKAPPVPEGPLDIDARNLLERLKSLRREIADELNAPAFVVFSDRTLRAMARTRPTSATQMLEIKGVGPQKWEAFGQRFLDLIQETPTEPRP